jgi:hypothetical protein
LDVGGRVARLIAHDPRLPPTIWASRTGLRDLVRAHRRFETCVGSLAQRFLNDVLEGRASANQQRTPKRPAARPVIARTRGSRERFDAALAKVPDVEPDADDRLEEASDKRVPSKSRRTRSRKRQTRKRPRG